MLKIFNTITREKETFTPINPAKVSMYVCGVTVYDYCHLGHARTYSAMDVVINYLMLIGFDVTHVRNITDIDDKIIKRAQEKAVTTDIITGEFTKAMHEDFAALGISLPQKEPKATDYISHMIELIQQLIAKDAAYVAKNGDVYFEIRKSKHYGCLSHHDIEQMQSGIRVEVSETKRDPLDFVLWKMAKPDEPAWDSPWGKGRPGWHTECVAMAQDLLGTKFDIHAGGRDLIFPHHENEIAQAHALKENSFANVWMHGGFLQIDREKMSKSLNNFVTIREVLKTYDAEVVRYFLVASHYRSPLIFTDTVLTQAKQSLSRLYGAMRSLNLSNALENSDYEKSFMNAMNDDFNTPIAFSVLFEIAHEIQRIKENDVATASLLAGLLKKLAKVFGILQKDPESFFTSSENIDTAKVDGLIAARENARANKDWKKADEIRAELLAMNIIVEDSAKGATWKVQS